MAMVLKNNIAAQTALAELNKNQSKGIKSKERLSSGVKINSPGDDAASYSISEKMRVQIRVLEQDIDNCQTGTNLIRIAEGGIQNIIENLRYIKEKALNAANDHNTDTDREMIQKEVNARLDEIDDIASTTNYNGRYLLNGNYGSARAIHNSGQARSAMTEPVYFNSNEGVNWTGIKGYSIFGIYASHQSYRDTFLMKDDLPVTGSTSLVAPSGRVNYLTTTPAVINTDGIYDISGLSKSSLIINAQNVELIGSSSSIDDLFIEVTASNAVLWLNSVNAVNNTSNDSMIAFKGDNNHLILKGHNSFTSYFNNDEAIIDVGGGLTIENALPDNEGTLKIEYASHFSSGAGANASRAYGAGIGTKGYGNPSLTINSGTLGISTVYGAAIGSCASYNCGDITINGGHIIADTYGHAAVIGTGTTGSMIYNTPTVGDITVKSSAILDLLAYGGSTIGPAGYEITGASTPRTKAGNIYVEGDNVRAYSLLGDAIGSGTGEGGTQIGTDERGFAIFPYHEWKSSIESIKTVNGAYYEPYRDNNGYHLFQGRSFLTEPYVPIATSNEEYNESYKKALIIHTGTNSSENMHIEINSMHSESLGVLGLKVVPIEEALKALATIDNAIDCALDENTRMGAYQVRLGFTVDNLTAAHENTTNAESVIRDTDMAKEVTENAKNNILTQAAQAMLAQANQNSANVIGLLGGEKL